MFKSVAGANYSVTGNMIPFHFESSSEGPDGHALPFFKDAARYHVNVKIKVRKEVDFTEDSFDLNGTDVISELRRNESDFALVCLTENSVKYVDYTIPIMTETWVWVSSPAVGGYKENFYALISMFTLQMWFGILATLIIFCLVCIKIRSIRNKPLMSKRCNESKEDILIYCIALAFHQGVGIYRNHGVRLLFLSWVIFTTVIIAFYNGLLYSMLTKPDEPTLIDKFTDVLKYPHLKIYLFMKTPIALRIERSKDPELQKIWDQSLATQGAVGYETFDAFQLVDEVLEGNAAGLAPRIIFMEFLPQFFDPDRTFYMSDHVVNWMPIVIAIRKGLREDLVNMTKFYANRIVEGGLYAFPLAGMTNYAELCMDAMQYKTYSGDSTNLMTIGLDRLKFPFLILIFGLLISLLVFLHEVLNGRSKIRLLTRLTKFIGILKSHTISSITQS